MPVFEIDSKGIESKLNKMIKFLELAKSKPNIISYDFNVSQSWNKARPQIDVSLNLIIEGTYDPDFSDRLEEAIHA